MARSVVNYRFTPNRRRALAVARKKSVAARRARAVAHQKKIERRRRNMKIAAYSAAGIAVVGGSAIAAGYGVHKIANLGVTIHKVPGPTPPNAALRKIRQGQMRYRHITMRPAGGIFSVNKSGTARFIRRPRQKYNNMRRKGYRTYSQMAKDRQRWFG